MREISKMTASMEKEPCFMDTIDQPTQVIGQTTNSMGKAHFTTNFHHLAMHPSTTAISTKSKNLGSNFKVLFSLS